MVLQFIFNYMVEYTEEKQLSDLFKCISDATRRSLLTQLSQEGPCRVTDLAAYYEMSLNAISKHIKALESNGLIQRKKVGRIHWIEADLARIGLAKAWLNNLKSIWALRLDELALITEQENQNE